VEAEYAVPYLAHSCMEPMNCTAHVVGDKVEIWVSTQNGEAALASAAQAAGVPPANVTVHKMHQGGGFGRRGAVQDYTREAVLIAKAVGKPVKLTWSREEDTQHDFYRPAAMARLTAGLDAQGRVVGWHTRIAGQGLIASLLPQNLPSDGIDRHFMSGFTEEFGYDVPNLLCDLALRPTHVPVGFWRAVNHTQNGFFKESFVDELAHAAGQDPYQFRRAMLQKKPRELAVLDAAAKAGGWESPPPAGIHRGIAVHHSYGSYVGNVVEVSVSPAGEFKLHRVVVAVDCGYVVNPRIVHQQVESGTVYGLTAILYGEITIKDGRVEQSNFHDYEMLRIHEMPKVETVLVPSGGFWGGIGEPTLAPLAPAIANAIFVATGKRIRSLPLKHHDLRKA
jgi:isoquinoline 1-oxidoreductase beta subunit